MGSTVIAWDLTPRRWCRRTHDPVVPVPLRAFALQTQRWSSPAFASKRRVWDTPSSLKHVHCAVMAACSLATSRIFSSSECCDMFIQTFLVNQHVQFGNTNTVPLRLAACTILYCCLASNSLCIQTPRRRPGHTAYHPKNCTSHSSSKQGEELCSVITSSIIQNPCPHMHTHTLATYPISF